MRRMKKVVLCTALVLGTLFSQTAVFAVNINSATEQQEMATPRYKHVAMMAGTLSITSAGQANCGANVALDRGYNVKVTMELQKYDSGDWNTLKSWSKSGSGPMGADLSESYKLSSSDMYQVKVTAYVTDSNGNYVESPVCYSVVREYNK